MRSFKLEMGGLAKITSEHIRVKANLESDYPKPKDLIDY